jgi:hypothetical protein
MQTYKMVIFEHCMIYNIEQNKTKFCVGQFSILPYNHKNPVIGFWMSSEWVLNEFWMSSEWVLNEFLMSSEWVLNEFWMSSEWVLEICLVQVIL